MLLAIAAVPVAAVAAMSREQVLAEAAKLPQQVPGQYRTSFELLSFDGPTGSKELAEASRSAPGGGAAEFSRSCVSPERADSGSAPHLVEEILEDDCTFEQFTVSGEEFVAVVQCPAEPNLPGRVTLNGRAAADGIDLLVAIEQKLPDKGMLRTKMRYTSERIGECA